MRHRSGPVWAALVPAAALVLLAGPVAAGLLGTLAPAFGWLPALGGTELTLEPWRALLETPGIAASMRLSLVTGVVATALSLAVALLVCAGLQGTRAFRWVERGLSPLLAFPHAAAAFGLAFLLAPSGWIARLLSPWATGWERPPDLLTVGDPGGLALIAGLVTKETPFLFLMTLAALAQADARRARITALALGYGRIWGWATAVLPRVYPQIRLPVYAVLAYAMSVVDMAVILGPTTPPTLSVRIVDWMADPDLALRFRAAAGAIAQLGLVVAALAAWRAGEAAIAALGRRLVLRGRRYPADRALRAGAGIAAAAVAGSMALGLATLALGSVSGYWPFPDALPQTVTAAAWRDQSAALAEPLATTATVAALSTALALVLAVGWLAGEERASGPRPYATALLYLPLLVPQTAFLFGLQTLAIALGVERGLAAVALAHLVFVLPYVFLSLAGPWRAWDRRHATVAASLGAGDLRILLAVRLPMLLLPLATAAAIGIAVSVTQYLPTRIVGAGRVETLATEAVALAAGGDRRLVGVTALVQTAAAALPFVLAYALPAFAFRRRRGLTVAP